MGAAWGTNLTGIPANVTNALNRTGDAISGRITMSVADGIFAGTNLNNGVYMGSGGLLGKKAGATTFAIDTAGNATFGGTLSAAAGTLGALTVNTGGNIKSGQTAYNTGTGFYIGTDSGVAKFSIGNSTAGQPSMLWDGTNLNINTATFDAFSASISGGTMTAAGSRTVTVTGGKPTLTYLWVFQRTDGAYAQVFITSGVTSATATLSGYGDGVSVAGRLICFVTDGNGRVTTASVAVAFSFPGGGGGP